MLSRLVLPAVTLIQGWLQANEYKKWGRETKKVKIRDHGMKNRKRKRKKINRQIK